MGVYSKIKRLFTARTNQADKRRAWSVGQSFNYTVPAGKWHVEEQHNFQQDGKGHSVIILTQKLTQQDTRSTDAKNGVHKIAKEKI